MAVVVLAVVVEVVVVDSEVEGSANVVGASGDSISDKLADADAQEKSGGWLGGELRGGGEDELRRDCSCCGKCSPDVGKPSTSISMAPWAATEARLPGGAVLEKGSVERSWMLALP